jgi:uncharacterized protein
MSVFAVEYVYDPQSAGIRDEHRPAHRAWLASLVQEGRLLASGPFADGTGALLIFKADDEAVLNQLLTEDPFAIAGGLGGRKASAWNPVIGELSGHAE